MLTDKKNTIYRIVVRFVSIDYEERSEIFNLIRIWLQIIMLVLCAFLNKKTTFCMTLNFLNSSNFLIFTGINC